MGQCLADFPVINTWVSQQQTVLELYVNLKLYTCIVVKLHHAPAFSWIWLLGLV